MNQDLVASLTDPQTEIADEPNPHYQTSHTSTMVSSCLDVATDPPRSHFVLRIYGMNGASFSKNAAREGAAARGEEVLRQVRSVAADQIGDPTHPSGGRRFFQSL